MAVLPPDGLAVYREVGGHQRWQVHRGERCLPLGCLLLVPALL